MIRFIALSIMLMALSFSINAQEWVELFKGKNLKGWEQLGGSAEYRVENGEVIGTSKARDAQLLYGD